jgi:hypothetical protein
MEQYAGSHYSSGGPDITKSDGAGCLILLEQKHYLYGVLDSSIREYLKTNRQGSHVH